MLRVLGYSSGDGRSGPDNYAIAERTAAGDRSAELTAIIQHIDDYKYD